MEPQKLVTLLFLFVVVLERKFYFVLLITRFRFNFSLIIGADAYYAITERTYEMLNSRMCG